MRELLKAEKGEDEDDSPTSQPAPLSHDVDYVISTWIEHRLHHLYPRAGGYDDQDADLMDDWRKMNLFYIRATKGDYSAIAFPTDAASWMDIARD